MKQLSRIPFVPCLVALSFLAAGCSTPQTRAQERAAAFDQLPPPEKDNALQGKVAVGMSQDAVYVALGKPSHISHVHVKGKVQECWTYTEMRTELIPNWEPIPLRTADGRIASTSHYAPLQVQVPRNALDVVFENGRVVRFAQPGR